MSLVEELRKTLFGARAIAGQLGFRPHTVAIIQTSWSGAHTGEGSSTESVIPITEGGGQPPKVRSLKDDEVAVGQLPQGTLEIGPVTPSFPGGGTDLSYLTGANLDRGDERFVLITGPSAPNGSRYRVVSVNTDKALRYMIRAVPVQQGGT